MQLRLRLFLVGAVVGSAMLSGCLAVEPPRPTGVPSAPGSVEPLSTSSSSSDHEDPQTSQPDTSPALSASGSALTLSYYDMDVEMRGDGSFTGLSIEYGVLGGAPTVMRHDVQRVPAPVLHGSVPTAVGPVDGLVAYSFFDGQRSEIHVVNTEDGSNATLFKPPDIVLALALDAVGRRLYYVAEDPQTGEENGIWWLPLDRSDLPRPLVLPDRRQDFEGPNLYEVIHLTPDGTSLLITRCAVFEGCLHRTVDTGSGEVRDLVAVPDEYPSPISITDRFFTASTDCHRPCGNVIVDLQTGQTTRYGGADGAALLLVDRSGDPVLIDTTILEDPARVTRIDLPTGREQMLWQGDPGLELVEFSDDGVEFPPGTVLLARGGRVGSLMDEDAAEALILDIDTGFISRLEDRIVE